jgi:hypothetical protein
MMPYYYDLLISFTFVRAFSAAGHSVLVYDYFLTLNDEVSPSRDIMMHTAEDVTTLVQDLVHLERPLDVRESHVPSQPLREPSWTDFHSAGRGWPPHQ